MARLELCGLVKRFGGQTAVGDVSLSLAEGEFLALLGPSGCGKTTTLRMVAGLAQPDAGRIVLDGRDITREPPRARGLAMVFQQYALFPHLTIFDNVAFGLELRRLRRDEIVRRVTDALAQVRLEGVEGRFPRQLSGGQQQRVALARAIVVEPRVLLFDEPLSNLDAKLRETMRDEIRSVQKRLGITTLYVTHDQAEALAVADRVAVMHQGRVQQVGAPVDVYEHPANLFVADFIGRTNLLRGIVQRTDGKLWAAVGHGLRVPLPSGTTASDGDATVVAVRPERVRLEPSVSDGTGLTGQVEGTTYLGSQVHVRVGTAAGPLLAVLANVGGWRAEPGETVSLAIRPEDCVVLPG